MVRYCCLMHYDGVDYHSLNALGDGDDCALEFAYADHSDIEHLKGYVTLNLKVKIQ